MRCVDIALNICDNMWLGTYNGRTGVHPPDLSRVLLRARKAGVVGMLALTAMPFEAMRAQEILAAPSPLAGVPLGRAFGVRLAVGVHPTHCTDVATHARSPSADLAAALAAISSAAAAGVLAAIGEIGLDYDRTHFCAADAQRAAFATQLDELLPAAAAADGGRLPAVVFHCRGDGATADLLAAIAPRRHLFSLGVAHSFTGTEEEAAALRGVGISVGLNAVSLRDAAGIAAVRALPPGGFLLGTDAPWCFPRRTHASAPFLPAAEVPKAVKKERWDPALLVDGRWEPCGVPAVAAAVARVRGEDPEALMSTVLAETFRVMPALRHAVDDAAEAWSAAGVDVAEVPLAP